MLLEEGTTKETYANGYSCGTHRERRRGFDASSIDYQI
jgi:hypothetical protein